MTATAAVATPLPTWGAHPVALTGEVLRRRIYAPLSYAPVRNVAVVPAVHSEAMALAAWFPLVWRRRPSGVEFVAVRALLDTQRAQPPAARGLLPLVLHGYPFIFDPAGPVTRDAAKMLDDVFADAPSNVGATITSVDHKLTRATVSRFRFLDRFAADLEPTAAIGAALDQAGLLAPWQLAFEIAGRQIGIPDLAMIRSEAFETGVLATILHRFGRPAATMISLHRLSLFRAGGLLATARTALKDAAADATQPPSAPPLQPVAP